MKNKPGRGGIFGRNYEKARKKKRKKVVLLGFSIPPVRVSKMGSSGVSELGRETMFSFPFFSSHFFALYLQKNGEKNSVSSSRSSCEAAFLRRMG